ncbi:MAG: SH3 domain-containing protein [Sphingobium sp.]|nr:SH3 domain-containing protein [Sphingobium sp.]
MKLAAPYHAAMLMAAMGGALAVSALTPAAHAQDRKPPYWASLDQDEARMRVGPGSQYPVSWVYRRRDLPVRVIATFPGWRKIEDPDGTQGWVAVRLLSARLTAMVVGDMAQMRDAPRREARVLYRAEPGVVGRVSDCANGWCAFDVRGQRGYVEVADIWGGK